MSRFNKTTPVPRKTAIVSTPSPLARTGNNAPGFVRDPQSELFLLAVGNFVGQDKHYETAAASDGRFTALIHHVAVQDPGWMGRFLPWLRNEANMRTAAITGAVEAARAMVHAKIPGGRAIVNSVLQRADEPGEALGYWRTTQPGRQIPKPIKRGIADAAARLYNEYTTLKYDTASKGYRFGDVLELTHASPDKPYQTVLFKHLIDRRHGREGIPSSLGMLHLNAKIRETFAKGHFEELGTEWIQAAGLTWEDVLSLAGSKVPKNELWEAMIPNMGYMALLRNLRNFDESGVGTLAYQFVVAKLSSPEEVARSRQLPMRFLSAYRAVNNVRWSYPLEQALQASLSNVPVFDGRTLILIDTSGSMNEVFSKDGSLRYWDAAAIFGLSLAARNHADVISFSNSNKVFPLRRGESLLTALERFKTGYYYGAGTQTEHAVRAHFNSSVHKRVIILTDEQANYHGHRDVAAAVPANIPVITFNLAGYKVGHMESGSATRITIAGLSDSAFKLLPVLEKRANGEWPF